MGDVTNRISRLGNLPAQDGMVDRERNIWDLQVYQGNIYLGFGQTTTNPGPIRLYHYDPSAAIFVDNYTVEAESIERLRVFDNKLFVPNSDMTSGDSEKYIYKDGSQITEISDGHQLAHVRDMYKYNNEYYLTGNSRCPKDKQPTCAGIVKQSTIGGPIDNTLLNSELVVVEPDSNALWNWSFGFLEIDNKLIIPNAMFTLTYNPTLVYKDNLFFQVNPNGSVEWSYNQPNATRLKHHMFYPVDNTVTFPNTLGVSTTLRPFEQVSINGDYLYSLRTYSVWQDYYVTQHNNSVAIIYKDNLLSDAKIVTFPDNQAVGEDLLTFNNEVYALANKKVGPSNFVVYVYKSGSPTDQSSTWQEVLRFTSTNRARSFEYDNGKFYFGLGNNYGEPTNDAGMLLCLTACANAPSAGIACDDNDPCTINDVTDGYGGCVGTFQDSDGDGVCDYYDNCPNQRYISSTLQFDVDFVARNQIDFDGLVNLSSTVTMNADAVILRPGAEILVPAIFIADIYGCP